MAQDYKHRAGLPRKGGKATTAPPTNPGQRKSPAKASKPNKPGVSARKPVSIVNTEKVSAWRWLLVVILVGVFAYFLYLISSTAEPEPEPSKPVKTVKTVKSVRQEVKKIALKPAPLKVIAPVAQKIKPIPKPEVQFDFYKVLPEAEFVVPDYEVKTRKREERIGKVKEGALYSVQAGSFRKYADADSLKAKLVLMGFSPNIEKAPVKSVTWYRVKMGPYKRMASVDAIISRLTDNDMDALVIEVKE
ncbi:MAG: SPOR domain-containing protein [Methyloprofundus sp.]|nr:SPOR domain-containing protein [Methyloprofundus sp.]MDT8424575.1 SPOR domain-containing protein [Methyloprofundus sp.]